MNIEINDYSKWVKNIINEYKNIIQSAKHAAVSPIMRLFALPLDCLEFPVETDSLMKWNP